MPIDKWKIDLQLIGIYFLNAPRKYSKAGSGKQETAVSKGHAIDLIGAEDWHRRDR